MLNARNADAPRLPSLQDPAPTPQHPSTESYSDQLRQFGRWLSNANIALYPIDANGLTTGAPAIAQWSASDEIATETGGRAIFFSNGIDYHLREIVRSTNSSYRLEYYPAGAAWDGKYHRVEVRLTSRGGLNVLCRKGYYASEEPKISSDDALSQAAASFVEAPGIGVSLRVHSNPLAPGRQELVLNFDARDTSFQPDGSRMKAGLDIAFVQMAKDGSIAEQFKDRIQLALTPKMYNTALNGGGSYRRQITVNANAEKLRVIVCDLATSAVGSVSVPVIDQKN
jgi:hypothetical protein